MANLLFKMGEYKNLAGTTKKAGTVYITKDEQSMYVDISDTERIKIQGTVAAYSTLTDFNSSVQPPYSTSVIYFIAEKNALVRYDGKNWIQLNTTAQDTNTAIENLTKLIQTNADDISALEKTTENHENRVKTLESEMDTAQADILAVAGRATSLEGRMTTAESDIDKVEGRATSLEGRMTTAEGDIEDLNDIAEDHGTRIGSLETRMQTAENTIGADNHTAANNTLKGNINDLKTRMQTAETAIGSDSDTAASNTMKGNINDLKARMGTAETDISNLEKTIGDFQTTVANTYVEKSVYNAKMKSLDDSIIGINTSIGNINTAIGTDETADTIKGRIKAVETRMGTAETDIGNLETGLSAVNDTIGADNHTAANKTLKGYINDLRSRVSTNETNITNVTTKANTNAEDIDKLEGRATSLEGRMTTAEKDIDDLTKYVDDTFATKTALQNTSDTLNKKIDDEIRAANAMTYKKGVASAAELPVIADGIKIGDTYIATVAFGAYQPGDLIVATGTEDTTTGLIKSGLVWDRVVTGYNTETQPKLFVEDNTVQLQSYTNAPLGSILLTSSAPNLVLTSNKDTGTIEFSMVWGSF